MFIIRALKLAVDEMVVSIEPELGKLSSSITVEGQFWFLLFAVAEQLWPEYELLDC
jgi:hypothetical protein